MKTNYQPLKKHFCLKMSVKNDIWKKLLHEKCAVQSTRLHEKCAASQYSALNRTFLMQLYFEPNIVWDTHFEERKKKTVGDDCLWLIMKQDILQKFTPGPISVEGRN